MDETQIIASIITGLFLLVSTYMTLRWRWPKQPPQGKAIEGIDKPKRRMPSKTIVGLWVVVAILFVVLIWSFAKSPGPFVRITYPFENAYVNLNETIRGTSQYVPEEKEIWVVVYVVGYRYYPAEKPAIVQADGDWSSFVWIGDEDDTNRSMCIIAVLADSTIQAKYDKYIQDSVASGFFPGLEVLEVKAEDIVSVTRK